MSTKKATLAAIAALALSATGGLAAQEHLKSLEPKYFDNNVAAGTDFFQHVNGGWMEANPLSSDRSRFTRFDVIADTNEVRIRDIVLNLGAQNPQPGTVAFKVATVYNQAMDSVRRNAEGAKPILPLLKKIENTTPDGMEDLFIWMHRNWGSPFLGAGPQENLVNSNEYAMYVSGAGLGMGDRDYYLKNDKRNKEVREAYQKLIVNQMRNAGYSKKDATRIMKNVMKIETMLADSVWTREESRNIPAMYNPRSFEFLKQNYPNIPWDRFFVETMDIESPENVIVTELNTVKQGDNLMGKLTDREKKDLYLWEIVSGAQSRLSDKFSDTAFEFSKVMSGVSEQRPRWKRALGATEGALGEAIGELYVERYFPQSSKDYMIGLVENLRTALGKHIITLDWMSPETKLNAIKKLNAFTVKIGYPDKWKDYSTMEVDPELSYFDNMHNINMWYVKDALSKWGKPVDKTQWGMNPQEVNAYYNPMANDHIIR